MSSSTFVPFFEKTTGGESLPQYQFNQFSQYKVSKVTLTPPKTIRHVEKDELKTKVLSDLKNALSLSLDPDALQQILNDLSKYRSSEKSLAEFSSDEGEPQMSTISAGQEGEKPTVKLQKDGDKVTNIVVECECGQVITMDCVY